VNGILCMNKPSGFTSFDVIAKLRGMLKIKRLGHSGTLDPMATGVLPVFVGNATKACDILPDNSKSYHAGFKLGLSTDTQDITGKIIQEYSKKISREDILEILPKFTGDILQTPPMYSAVKIGGRKLYDLARKGVEIERPERKIHIGSITLKSFDEESQSGTLFIICSKGTYIRTIINDIGDMLGCGGIMTSLVRTFSGGFSLDDCFTFDEVQQAVDSGDIESLLISVDMPFMSYPAVRLNKHQTQLYKNGVKLDLSKLKHISADKDKYRIYGFDKAFMGLALAEHDNNILRVYKNLV